MKYIKPEEYENELRELNEKGLTLKQLSEHFGITSAGVKFRLKKLGLEKNPSITPFTEEQKQKMLELHEKPMSAIEIAKIIGTTQWRVLKFLNDSGKDTSYIRFNKQQIDSIIKDYKDGYTFAMLEEKYQTLRQCLGNILRKNGVVKRTRREVKQNSWYVWEDAFRDMTDERALFFYGLLLADGCLSKDNEAVVISLQARDKKILDDLRVYLKIEKELTFRKRREPHHQDVYALSFKDKVVASTLMSYGFSSRKSLKEKPPTIKMTDDQARHFWRGCIAGDGSILMNNGSIPCVFLCGSEELITEFSLFVQRVVGMINPPKVNKVSKGEGRPFIYNVKVSGNLAVDLANVLFKDSTVNMERKYETYLRFKEYKPKFVHYKNRTTPTPVV